MSDYSDYLKPGKESRVEVNNLLVNHCINVHSNYCENIDLMLFRCDIIYYIIGIILMLIHILVRSLK